MTRLDNSPCVCMRVFHSSQTVRRSLNSSHIRPECTSCRAGGCIIDAVLTDERDGASSLHMRNLLRGSPCVKIPPADSVPVSLGLGLEFTPSAASDNRVNKSFPGSWRGVARCYPARPDLILPAATPPDYHRLTCRGTLEEP